MVAGLSTELNILEAARKVFMQKGFAAARMCDIAKTANINPALLHYYFRKKEKLFDVIFEQELDGFHSDIMSILHSGRTFFEKIRLIIDKDIQKVASAPFLPMFILNEMHSNPERMQRSLGIIQRHSALFNVFREVVEREHLAGRIRAVCPQQLFLSIWGLTMFPFLAQPMVKMALEIDDQSFDALIRERSEYVSDMLIKSLQV